MTKEELLKHTIPDGYIIVPASAWDELVQMESERDALAAKLAMITKAWQDAGRWPDLASDIEKIELLIQSKPAICLPEIQAEAGRAGFVAGLEYPDLVYFQDATGDLNVAADQYAAQVRQGGAE